MIVTQLIHGISWIVIGAITISTGVGGFLLGNGITITSGAIIYTIKNIESNRQKISTPKIHDNKEDSFYTIMK